MGMQFPNESPEMTQEAKQSASTPDQQELVNAASKLPDSPEKSEMMRQLAKSFKMMDEMMKAGNPEITNVPIAPGSSMQWSITEANAMLPQDKEGISNIINAYNVAIGNAFEKYATQKYGGHIHTPEEAKPETPSLD